MRPNSSFKPKPSARLYLGIMKNMRHIVFLFAIALSTSWGTVAAQGIVTGYGVQPMQPYSSDEVIVYVSFAFGPFVDTSYYEIEGNNITATFIQDGFDFSPNPPHGASLSLGRLAPGNYTISIVTIHSPSAQTSRTLQLRVASHAVPSLSIFGWVVLALIIMVAAVFHRKQMH
jgi:hypothetical protein